MRIGFGKFSAPSHAASRRNAKTAFRGLGPSASWLEQLVCRHLTHTEMGYVLPVILAALPEFESIDCVLEVPSVVTGLGGDARRPRSPCLRVALEGEAGAAQAVLERMAAAVVEADPYQLTSIDEARALFGVASPCDGRYARLFGALLRRVFTGER